MKYRDPIVITSLSMGLALGAYLLAHGATSIWLTALATGAAAGVGAVLGMALLKRKGR
jgi:uncharacterized protein YqfA (UPF0365 family)